MKKTIIALLALTLFSFKANQAKTITLTFSIEEVQLIYSALGKLPAEQVEGLRAKIVVETNKQLADTAIKKK